MRHDLANICLAFALQLGSGVAAFTPPIHQPRISSATTRSSLSGVGDENIEKTPTNSRRSLLLGAGLATAAQFSLSRAQPAWAADEETDTSGGDMTKQLFNEDGSLREGEVEEAKFRTVDIAWPGLSESDGKYLVCEDGKAPDSGSGVRLSYKVPETWQQQANGYFDKSKSSGTTNKVSEKITVYRAPGRVSLDRLAKAATIGVGEALFVPDNLSILRKADLLSGKTRKQGDLKFYDFDMASAPKECEMSPENLGLGFCPFDTIYLLSAVVIDDALYVIAVESDKSEWKVASADLKRIRSSFAFA